MNAIGSVIQVFVSIGNVLFSAVGAVFKLLYKLLEICKIPKLCELIYLGIAFLCYQIITLGSILYYAIYKVVSEINSIVVRIAQMLKLPEIWNYLYTNFKKLFWWIVDKLAILFWNILI